MISKLSQLLSGVFQPIKSTPRPGQQIQFKSSEKSEDGGHGALGYDASFSESDSSPNDGDELEIDSEAAYHQSLNAIPFQPGLTKVILEVISKVQETHHSSSSARISPYQEQKKDPTPPKGGVIDKKAG